ncbi:MAG: hypothetical protein ACMZ7B_06575 [Balneola sp.]
MKNHLIISMLAFSAISLSIQAQVVRGMPQYESNQIEEIIGEMIEAHGGWESWANASSIKYDNIFYNTGAGQGQNPWWVSTEVIEQTGSEVNERRVYQKYHIGGAKGGFTMGYDRNEVWAKDWAIGNYPKMMQYFFYYFLNLPWLTQDDLVVLSDLQEKEYNGKEVFTIRMTFKGKPAIGKTSNDSFNLFIHKDSHQLLAYEYSIGFGAQLDAMGIPKEREVLGPVFRHIDEYTEVEGLLFPARMHTTNQSQANIYGHHVLINYSVTTPFDSLKSEKPEGALVDHSSHLRAKE